MNDSDFKYSQKHSEIIARFAHRGTYGRVLGRIRFMCYVPRWKNA
jgi:hypothetical protein